MNKEVLCPGPDVHAENIAVAIAEAGRDGEVMNYRMISSDLRAGKMDKLRVGLTLWLQNAGTKAMRMV